MLGAFLFFYLISYIEKQAQFRKLEISDKVSIIVKTGAKSMNSARKAYEMALEEANLKEEDISLIVGTGYGRYNIDFVDENVTEITCHGKGAHFLNNEVRTIIDIGGQDSKAISLDEEGNVKTFNAVARFDSNIEVDYYRNGGILQKVLRSRLNA